jgi:hypothetical protein
MDDGRWTNKKGGGGDVWAITLIRGASSDTILDTLSEPSVHRLSSIVCCPSSVVRRL